MRADEEHLGKTVGAAARAARLRRAGDSVLYALMDRQLTRRMTANFISHGEVVAEALAKSVEPALVGRDLTSVQSALDGVLSIANVQWAFVTGPDGRVLAHTFVPKFPDALKNRTRDLNDRFAITLKGC
jgi:hypothetical protein